MHLPNLSIPLGVALALMLAACTGSPSASPAATGGEDRLAGTDWALQSMGDEAVPAGITATLSFLDGTASGSSGCNTFSGAYATDGPSNISIGPLASTRKACIEAVMAFEQSYLSALDGASAWAVPQDAPLGTQLTITGSGLKLVFGKPDGG
jgi:heat shock protein HslJ